MASRLQASIFVGRAVTFLRVTAPYTIILFLLTSIIPKHLPQINKNTSATRKVFSRSRDNVIKTNRNTLGVAQHHCVGSDLAVRYCIFRGIYYDTRRKLFVLPRQSEAGPVLFDTSQDYDKFPRQLAWLSSTYKRNGAAAFTVETAHNFNPIGPVKHLKGRYIIWDEINPGNFGHMIADNLLPIFTILYELSFASRWISTFNMLLVRGNRNLDPCNSPIHENMYRFLTSRPLLCWEELLKYTSQKYIFFPLLVAGGGGFLTNPAQRNLWRNHGRSVYWWQFRLHALQQTNYEEVSESVRERRLAFKVKTTGPHSPKPYRLIINAEETATVIRKTFPSNEVIVYSFPNTSQIQEIHLLASSSILITSIGGASFGIPFLPQGAAIILVGSRTSRAKHYRLGTGHNIPFIESEVLWRQLSYLRVYHHAANATIPGQPRTTNFLVRPWDICTTIRQVQRERWSWVVDAS